MQSQISSSLVLNEPLVEVDFMRISYQHLDMKKYFLGSMASLVTGRVLTYPFVFAKTIHQTQCMTSPKNFSCLELLSSTIKSEGAGALYKGFPAYLCGMLPSHVAHIYAFEFARSKLGGYGSENFQIFCSSFVASIVSVVISTPSDIVSQRMMVRGKLQHMPTVSASLFGTCKKIAFAEGFSGFYRGFSSAVTTSLVSSVIWWNTYYNLKKFLSSFQSDSPSRTQFMASQAFAGGAASFLVTALINPLDVIKTRIQVLNSQSFLSTVRNLIKTEGFQWMSRGLTPRIVSAASVSAATISLYEEVKRLSVKPNVQIKY